MRKIFLWFYCLPFGEAALLLLLASLLFWFLRKKLGDTAFWKTGILLLFLVWIAVIFFGTLGQRTEDGSLSPPILMPFASYCAVLNGGSRELLRTNFMNVVLFYPAGLLGCEALPKKWRKGWKGVLITVLLALVSGCIEYTQYQFGLGMAETDDVIHNTLGALLGGIVISIL